MGFALFKAMILYVRVLMGIRESFVKVLRAILILIMHYIPAITTEIVKLTDLITIVNVVNHISETTVNHNLVQNLFVQTDKFAVGVKSTDTSLIVNVIIHMLGITVNLNIPVDAMNKIAKMVELVILSSPIVRRNVSVKMVIPAICVS